jgi:hypothetical protein
MLTLSERHLGFERRTLAAVNNNRKDTHMTTYTPERHSAPSIIFGNVKVPGDSAFTHQGFTIVPGIAESTILGLCAGCGGNLTLSNFLFWENILKEPPGCVNCQAMAGVPDHLQGTTRSSELKGGDTREID